MVQLQQRHLVRPTGVSPPDRNRPSPPGGRVGALALLAAAELSHGAVFLVPDPTWACAAALLLTVAVPGALLAMLVVPTDGTEPAEWLVTALGLGVAMLVASGLVLAYLPLRLGPTALLAWFDGLALLLAAAILRVRRDWRLP